MGGTYAICLQLFIGFAALVSLLYKREYMDKEPKRPYLIWIMDVSKQVIAESTLHVYNVAFGIIIDSMDESTSNDQCAFYLMNETMDTIIGTFFVWMLTRAFEHMGRVYQIKELENTGYYGSPPQANHYIMQLATFMIANLVGKTIVTLMCLSDPEAVEGVGSFFFHELGIGPDFELTLVMVVIPLILTIAQMWVVDMFLGFDTEDEGNQGYHYRQLQSGSDNPTGGNYAVLNRMHGLDPLVYTPPRPMDNQFRSSSLERSLSQGL